MVQRVQLHGKQLQDSSTMVAYSMPYMEMILLEAVL